MGNQQVVPRSARSRSEVRQGRGLAGSLTLPRRKTQSKDDSVINRHQIVSCPDLAGPPESIRTHTSTAENYEGPREIRQVDLRVFPGFDTLDDGGEFHKSVIYAKEPVVNIKIYRHSGASTTGRRRGESKEARGPSIKRVSGGTVADQSGSSVATEESRVSVERKSFVKSASASPFVNPVRSFPSTELVTQRQSLFESHFVDALLRRHDSLPSRTARTSILSVALHLRSHPHRHISLYRYLIKRDVPAQLLEPDEENCGEYILTIPDALFYGVMHARSKLEQGSSEPSINGNGTAGSRESGELTSDSDLSTMGDIDLALGQDLLMCVGVEAAAELSRMFEYQLSVMSDDNAVKLFAEHAVECAVNYSVQRRGTLWERNSLVRGAIFGQFDDENESCDEDEGVDETSRRKYISVIIGQTELKWDLYNVLKKPALRLERMLFNENRDNTELWDFRSSPSCDHLVYGYRGVMLDWDYFAQAYVVNGEDLARFDRDVPSNVTDIHRSYPPYKILIGTEVMHGYCVIPAKEKQPLTQYVRGRLVGLGWERDQVQPVYRPLKALALGTTALRRANFDDCDLTRIQLRGIDLKRTTLRRANLKLARLSSTRLGEAEIYEGADLSFSSAHDTKLPEGLLVAARSTQYAMITGSQAQDDMPGPSLLPAHSQALSDPYEGLDRTQIVTYVCDRTGRVVGVEETIESLQKGYKERQRKIKKLSEERSSRSSRSQKMPEIKSKTKRKTDRNSSNKMSEKKILDLKSKDNDEIKNVMDDHFDTTSKQSVLNSNDSESTYPMSASLNGKDDQSVDSKKPKKKHRAAQLKQESERIVGLVSEKVTQLSNRAKKSYAQNLSQLKASHSSYHASSTSLKSDKNLPPSKSSSDLKTSDKIVKSKSEIPEPSEKIISETSDKTEPSENVKSEIPILESECRIETKAEHSEIVDTISKDKMNGTEIKGKISLAHPKSLTDKIDSVSDRASSKRLNMKEQRDKFLSSPSPSQSVRSTSPGFHELGRAYPKKSATSELSDKKDDAILSPTAESVVATPVDLYKRVEVPKDNISKISNDNISKSKSKIDEENNKIKADSSVKLSIKQTSADNNREDVTDNGNLLADFSIPDSNIKKELPLEVVCVAGPETVVSNENQPDIKSNISKDQKKSKSSSPKKTSPKKASPRKGSPGKFSPKKDDLGELTLKQETLQQQTNAENNLVEESSIVNNPVLETGAIKDNNKVQETDSRLTESSNTSQITKHEIPSAIATSSELYPAVHEISSYSTSDDTALSVIDDYTTRVSVAVVDDVTIDMKSTAQDNSAVLTQVTCSPKKTSRRTVIPPESLNTSKILPPTLTVEFLDSSPTSFTTPTRLLSPSTPTKSRSTLTPTKSPVLSPLLSSDIIGKVYGTNSGYLAEIRSSMPSLNVNEAEKEELEDVEMLRPQSRGLENIERIAVPPSERRMSKSRSLQALCQLESSHAGHEGDISADEKSEKGVKEGGWIPRVLSQADLNVINKSQLFRIITTELKTEQLLTSLPSLDRYLMGRDREVDDLADLLSQSGRMVIVTGCHGVGKSSVSLAACYAVTRRSSKTVAVRVDMRGCLSIDGVIGRTVRAFSLRMRPEHRVCFYRWLEAHRKQKLLLYFDNLDLPTADERRNVARFIDELTSSVKNISVLCTCRIAPPVLTEEERRWEGGSANVMASTRPASAVTREVYRVGELRPDAAESLIKKLLPELHNRGPTQLCEACEKIPYAIRVVASTFRLGSEERVDTGSLFEELIRVSRTHDLMTRLKEAGLDGMGEDDLERRRHYKVVMCVLRILDALHHDTVLVLTKASVFAAAFDLKSLETVIGTLDKKSNIKTALETLCKIGFMERFSLKPDRFTLPPLIRFIGQSLLADNGAADKACVLLTLNKLKESVNNYHGRNASTIVRSALSIHDDIFDVIWRTIETERVIEQGFSCLASLEGATFLSEILSENTYAALYEQLECEAVNQEESSLRCRALCCLSYGAAAVFNDPVSALSSAERASAVLEETSRDEDRAFVLYCTSLAMSVCGGDPQRALTLARRAFDASKRAANRLNNVSTLYAGELYSRALAHVDNHQMARHWCNVFDAAVRDNLDRHPVRVESLEARRAIWDRLELFERATAAARKAAETARSYYGLDHPRTAETLARLADAAAKRGFMAEAVAAGAGAVAVRSRVLGDHVSTVESYRTLASLMIKSRQYDRGSEYAQSGIEMLARLERQITDSSTEEGGASEALDIIERLREELSQAVNQATSRSASRASSHERQV